MEDIIEEIVGEIADETDNDRDLIVLVEPNQWRVDGRFPVEDAVELGWPVEESDDYETLAGWIIHELDSVRVGDELLVDGYAFWWKMRPLAHFHRAGEEVAIGKLVKSR